MQDPTGFKGRGAGWGPSGCSRAGCPGGVLRRDGRRQDTSDAGQKEVGVWTRELIDAALSLGGSFYLPYQLHATKEQFLRAYPRAPEFFELKRRFDPTNKFRNELWDKYYRP
jgi:hypothetical protein